MQKFIALLVLSTVLMSLVGCQDKKSNLQDKKSDFEIKFHEDVKGEPAKIDQYVIFHFALIHEGEDTLSSSYVQEAPFSMVLKPINEEDMLVRLLSKMSKGDSASFFTNAEKYYKAEGKELPDSINADSQLEFNVKMLDVMNPKQMSERRRKQEESHILNYIKANNYTNVQREPNSGLYIIYEKQGTGQFAQYGDSIFIKYTTKQLNGNIVDSSDGNERHLILGEQKLIDAWDIALTKLMPMGTKATLIVPSHLGFKDKSKEFTYGNLVHKLGPFTVLVCELELTKIYRKGIQ